MSVFIGKYAPIIVFHCSHFLKFSLKTCIFKLDKSKIDELD